MVTDEQLEMSFVQVSLERCPQVSLDCRPFDELTGFDLAELSARFPRRFREYCKERAKENARLRRKVWRARR